MRIPQFADLTADDRQRVLDTIADGRMIVAIKQLRDATHCSLAFAHLWVAHRGEAVAPPGDEPVPCPHCGQPLRTPLAKQCRFCKRDWH